MEKVIYDEKNGLWYELQGDYYIPCLKLPEEEQQPTIANCFFEQYLMDDFCNKVMRIMLIEQFNNDDVRKLYQYWLMDEPLSFQRKIFSGLKSAGMITKCDSEYLAVKYYAPIYFYAQKWLFSGELTEENKESFRTDAYKHIQMFFGGIGGYNG